MTEIMQKREELELRKRELLDYFKASLEEAKNINEERASRAFKLFISTIIPKILTFIEEENIIKLLVTIENFDGLVTTFNGTLIPEYLDGESYQIFLEKISDFLDFYNIGTIKVNDLKVEIDLEVDYKTLKEVSLMELQRIDYLKEEEKNIRR